MPARSNRDAKNLRVGDSFALQCRKATAFRLDPINTCLGCFGSLGHDKKVWKAEA